MKAVAAKAQSETADSPRAAAQRFSEDAQYTEHVPALHGPGSSQRDNPT
ncbi:MAG: hypothetical protein MUF81_04895 [Verrucomicrobia bacterium]|nr:hypothetical protein [Verrucomicrobiota bacterium]